MAKIAFNVPQGNTPYSFLSPIIAVYTESDPRKINAIKNVLNSAWEKVWDRATPDSFVGSLLCRKIIRFRGSEAFLKHIYPSLVDIAAQPLERRFFVLVAKYLIFNNFFIIIFPRLEKGSLTSSNCYPSVNGIACKKVSSKVNSFVVEIFVNNSGTVEILCDASHSWHIGNVSIRSTIIHELGHILLHLTISSERLSILRSNRSWKWDRKDEEIVISLENSFLLQRKEMTRTSHNGFPIRSFEELSSTEQLYKALKCGADGTVKKLCDQHLIAPKGSSARIEYSARRIEAYVKALFFDVPTSEELLTSEDQEHQALAGVHKRRALHHLIALLQTIKSEPDGFQPLNELIFHITKKVTPTQLIELLPMSYPIFILKKPVSGSKFDKEVPTQKT